MSAKLIDRLKRILSTAPVSQETRAELAKASTIREGIERLDDLITANELEFRTLQKELEELERRLQEEEEQVETEGLGRRSARVARMRVEQLERHADTMEHRLKIHDANLRLQVALLGKLQALEAMDLRGLDEQQVDSITLDFEEELKEYTAVLDAAEIAADRVRENRAANSASRGEEGAGLELPARSRVSEQGRPRPEGEGEVSQAPAEEAPAEKANRKWPTERRLEVEE